MVNRISHSRLKDYLNCPLLFYYRAVLGLRLKETPIHLHFGKALHKALELKTTSDKPLTETFKEEFTDADLSPADLTKYLELRAKGIELLKKYEEMEDEIKSQGIIITSTERKIEAAKVVDPKSKTPLAFDEMVGILDFETKDGRIGDYKTSGKPYKQEEIDISHQPTMYYLLYYLDKGIMPNGFIYIVFNKKRKREPIQILETHRTFQDITNLIELMNNVYAKVDRRLFERGHDENAYCDCFRYDELLRV